MIRNAEVLRGAVEFGAPGVAQEVIQDRGEALHLPLQGSQALQAAALAPRGLRGLLALGGREPPRPLLLQERQVNGHGGEGVFYLVGQARRQATEVPGRLAAVPGLARGA